MKKSFCGVNVFILTLVLLCSPFLQASDSIYISIQDTELFTFTEDFYGIQYNRYAYNDTTSLNKLEKLNLKWLRL